jgi:phenylalanyl-tRNA synthetase alpha chain
VKDQLMQLLQEGLKELQLVVSSQDLMNYKVKYLGKKGELTVIMKEMGKLSAEERPVIGQVANEVRAQLEESIRLVQEKLLEKERAEQFENERIDVTLPSEKLHEGTFHPLYHVLDTIKGIFIGMGYQIAQGPEIDTVYNNFDALNAPIDHPSRSESDTFYITDNLLLRTQTSPVQIRTMKAQQPPIKVISPGRCFRKDEIDATHSPMFHQIEGLMVGENITMSDLKGTLNAFVHKMFGEHVRTKFRPHFFPFTEPSGEMDVSCFKCDGIGCKFCSGSGWIEILGCGMVHPSVLEECGIDSQKYSGFAFGMGLDRITMLKYEIDDIRHLFENDVRFLKQF